MMFSVSWTVANYLQDDSVEQGRFAYQSYSPSEVYVEESVFDCPTQITSDVNQFGADYIEVNCPGTYTLNFKEPPQPTYCLSNPHLLEIISSGQTWETNLICLSLRLSI